MRLTISIVPALLIMLGSTLSPSLAYASDRFTFTRPPAPPSAVDVVDAQGRLAVDVVRWSTDAERDRVIAALASQGAERTLHVLQDVPRLGTLRWPGGTEYTVRYAREVTRPTGEREVVLLVDRPLWLWWTQNPPSTPYPFTLVQLRLGKDGRGEGRVSLGVSVKSDPAAGIVLADYGSAPAVLEDVRREKADS
jgi:hypothetical protein